jgi:hypothetical protein
VMAGPDYFRLADCPRVIGIVTWTKIR